MSYIGNSPVLPTTEYREEHTVTGSPQSLFNTLGYEPGYISVYRNGIRLAETEDFLATDGSSVLLSENAEVGDIVAFEYRTEVSTILDNSIDVSKLNLIDNSIPLSAVEVTANSIPIEAVEVTANSIPVSAIDGLNNPNHIAFDTGTSPTMDFTSITGDYQIMIFDCSQWSYRYVNQGNHYDKTTGYFTCPIAGLYYAYASIHSNGAQRWQIVKNDLWVRGAAGSTSPNWLNVSTSVTLKCEEGDTICILGAPESYQHGDAAWGGWGVFFIG